MIRNFRKKNYFPLSCRKRFVKRKHSLLTLIRIKICILNIHVKEIMTISLYFCKTISYSSYLKPSLPGKLVTMI